MALVKYDLHCHSTASDGALAPIELFSRAQQQQIEVLALTDHDTVLGVAQLIDMQGCGQLLATPRILGRCRIYCSTRRPGASYSWAWNRRNSSAN